MPTERYQRFIDLTREALEREQQQQDQQQQGMSNQQPMTVSELLDYLTQIAAEGGGDLPVALEGREDLPDDYEGDYVSLSFALTEGARG